MKYTCLNCGATAQDPSTLCNPGDDVKLSPFCATATEPVCNDHRDTMEYSCGKCGGLSPDADHLCYPFKFK